MLIKYLKKQPLFSFIKFENQSYRSSPIMFQVYNLLTKLLSYKRPLSCDLYLEHPSVTMHEWSHWFLWIKFSDISFSCFLLVRREKKSNNNNHAAQQMQMFAVPLIFWTLEYNKKKLLLGPVEECACQMQLEKFPAASN